MIRLAVARAMTRAGVATLWVALVGCAADESALPAARALTSAHERPNGAEYSPGGDRLAYWTVGAEGAELYVAAADMSDPVLLATRINADNPVWSPDGRDVAYVLLSGIDIWTAPAAGGASRQVTNTTGYEGPITYHPDGSRLTYVATGGGGVFTLNVLDLERLTSQPWMLNGEAAAGDWSPDGTRAWFAVPFPSPEATLWVADADGRNARQLTTPEDRAQLPEWSPDGRHLSYVSDRTGFGDVWVVPADGGAARQLTRDVRDDYAPQWSPDGRWLAFLSDRGRQTDVWVVSVEGGPERRVTDDTEVEREVRWRPGSTELKYEVEARREALWAVSVRDGTERQLTGDTLAIGAAFLSPTSAHGVLTLPRGGGVTDLYLLAIDDGELTPLVANGSANTAPRWSPDGSQVAFVSNRAGNQDIWVVSAGGGEPRRLTEHRGLDSEPAWSADGSLIYFSSQREGRWDVWSVRPDGTQERAVTTMGNVGTFTTIPGRPELLLGVLNEGSGAFEVYLSTPEGAARPLWTRTAAAFPDDDQPGGDLAAVAELQDDGTFTTWLVSLTTGATRQILDSFEDLNAFSPDGRRFVYTVGARLSDLAVLTVADSAVQRLTETPDLHERDAEWSADGETILFFRGRTTRQVKVADVGALIGG